MANLNHSLYVKNKSKNKIISKFDKFIFIASFMAPLNGIPQVIDVLHGNTNGVSLFSWLGFMVFSSLFFIYGLIHKINPMIITNLLYAIIDGLIVLGLILSKIN